MPRQKGDLKLRNQAPRDVGEISIVQDETELICTVSSPSGVVADALLWLYSINEHVR